MIHFSRLFSVLVFCIFFSGFLFKIYRLQVFTYGIQFLLDVFSLIRCLCCNICFCYIFCLMKIHCLSLHGFCNFQQRIYISNQCMILVNLKAQRMDKNLHQDHQLPSMLKMNFIVKSNVLWYDN